MVLQSMCRVVSVGVSWMKLSYTRSHELIQCAGTYILVDLPQFFINFRPNFYFKIPIKERECVCYASMLQLFGGLFITLPVRPVLLYCLCSTYTVHCVVAGAQCIVSQCQHHCTCSTYTVDLVFVRIA